MNWLPILVALALVAIPTAIPASYLLFQRLAKDPDNTINRSRLPPKLQQYISEHRVRVHITLSALGLMFCAAIIWLVLPFSGLPEAVLILLTLMVVIEAVIIGTWAWRQLRRLVRKLPPPEPGTPGEFVHLKQSEYLDEIGKKYFSGSYVRILMWEVILLVVYAAVGLIAFFMFER